jgi:hypothetical protein
MTKYHGKNIVFSIEDGPSVQPTTNGTLVLSRSLTTVDLPRTADEVDITTFGAGDFRSFLAGFQGSTVRLAGFFDDSVIAVGGDTGADVALDAWLAFGTQTRKFCFSPSGTATGKIAYVGTAIILGYSLTGAIGNAVGFTTDLRVTGAVGRRTWPNII